MAINFSFTINSANLAKIYREKNAYTNCLSFFVDEESYIFRGLSLTIDGTSGIIEKTYEYNGVKLEISLTISNITSSRSTYNATASVNYTINGEEYAYPNGATLDWSIENSIILRDNNGYMPADTTGANPENEYYFLTSDTSVIQGKTYYQLVTLGEDSYSYNVVNNPSGNPKNLGYYEAAPKKYYTQETNGINIDGESASFIRLDKYGLYGVTKGSLTSDAVPRGISQIQDEAMFSLTWDGYTLKTTHPDGNGFIKIGASDDIVISTINTYIDDQGIEQKIEEIVAKLGYLSEDDLESAGGALNPLCGLYGIFSKNIYIGDGENFLAYYSNSDNSTFEVRTDNFYFNTVDVDGETSIQDITQKTRSLVDEMGVLYRKLDAWIEVGDYTEEGQPTTVALKIADHNNPSQASELVLTSDKMIFKKNEKDVAYVSARDNDYGFSIKDGFIDKKLQFNDYAFITRDNGNFSLKYIGV